jgi:UDP-glucose 4-epimerase
METILVTGGAGFIGSILVDFLIEKKIKVIVVDNLCNSTHQLINKKAIFYKVNILNTKKINSILAHHEIDTVIHLASLISVRDSIKDSKKYYLNNVFGTKSILSAAKNTNVKNFIFSSSCAVYKDNKVQNLINEKSKIYPNNIYGNTKLASEKAIKKYSKKNNLNYIILRFFNVVGAKINKKPYLGQIKNQGQLFQNICLCILKKLSYFEIYGNDYPTIDGTCVRDFIHVLDLVQIIYLSINYLETKKKSETFNCGYGKGYTVKQIIQSFEETIKKKINYKIGPRRSKEIIYSVCDNKKILKKLKWKSRHSNIKNMIEDTYKWFNFLHKKLKNNP